MSGTQLQSPFLNQLTNFLGKNTCPAADPNLVRASEVLALQLENVLDARRVQPPAVPESAERKLAQNDDDIESLLTRNSILTDQINDLTGKCDYVESLRTQLYIAGQNRPKPWNSAPPAIQPRLEKVAAFMTAQENASRALVADWMTQVAKGGGGGLPTRANIQSAVRTAIAGVGGGLDEKKMMALVESIVSGVISN